MITTETQELLAQIAQLQAEVTRLKLIAYIDGLTGVANRRAFDEALEREWGRSIREGDAVSLLMVDIDHFKKFNDTWGHAKGDQVLVKVAQSLASVPSRPADLVARYGGEEFAVLLPGTNEAGASAVAHLCLEAVRSVGASVSIGVSTIRPIPFSPKEAIVVSADEALYRAKDWGRNQVVVAGV